MRSRRGFTLVETLIVIALTGTAMILVAVAMTGIQRANSRVREETSLERDRLRLAAQLRTDAHEAMQAAIEAGTDEDASAGTLVLTLAKGESVRYVLQSGQIERQKRSGDELRHRETYRISEELSAGWELEESGSSAMVTLKMDPETLDPGGMPGGRSTQINAAVGLLGPLKEGS